MIGTTVVEAYSRRSVPREPMGDFDSKFDPERVDCKSEAFRAGEQAAHNRGSMHESFQKLVMEAQAWNCGAAEATRRRNVMRDSYVGGDLTACKLPLYGELCKTDEGQAVFKTTRAAAMRKFARGWVDAQSTLAGQPTARAKAAAAKYVMQHCHTRVNVEKQHSLMLVALHHALSLQEAGTVRAVPATCNRGAPS